MADIEVASSSEIADFLTAIYGTVKGYAYIATKTPVDRNKSVKDTQWSQEFFAWPREKDKVAKYIQDKTRTREVYFSPALFTEPSALKENVLGSNAFWCEFDGRVPSDLKGIPEPSIRVQSSKRGHEHWYWLTASTNSPEKLEEVNRSITYALGADASGWDAGQVLRPIGTRNHKREAAVTLLGYSDGLYRAEDFEDLPEPPPVEEVPELDSIPPIEDVIPKYIFNEEVWALFKEGNPEDRSDGLMALGYYLAELQLPNDEMFAMLLNADERWGKFSGRSDQHKRLMEIVVRSRIKYPLIDSVFQQEGMESIGFKSVIEAKVNVEWIWEGFLHRRGYMLITGPSGVGKTQFSLNAASRMVLGQGFLHRKTHSQNEKIAFFSMEMGIIELQQFLNLQAQGFTEEELNILEERLRFFPLGEPIYMTQEREKERIEKIIEDEGFTGVIFDSLGSATDGSLSSEENTKNLMDWNDKLRKKFDIFTWYIHHHRKPNGDNKKPNKLGDVYGSQYITARATTVIALWGALKGEVEILPLKTRLTAKPEPFKAFRDKHLHFHPKIGSITITEDKEPDESDEIVEEEKKLTKNKDFKPMSGGFDF